MSVYIYYVPIYVNTYQYPISKDRYGTVRYVQIVCMFSLYDMYRQYGRVCTDRTVCTFYVRRYVWYVRMYLVPTTI